METITLGIIGAGAIATHHLSALSGIPWMRAVGITSRTRAKAEALSSAYAIPYCADTIEELIEKTQPDALLVLVSANQMHTVAKRLMKYRVPLFLEKPAGMTPEESNDLLHDAQRLMVPTMVGFNRRYYSVFRKGIEIIKGQGPLLGVNIEGHERIWRIHEDEHRSRQEIDNWVFVNSVHTIDLLRYFGGEPRSVSVLNARRFGEARGDQFGALMCLDAGCIGQYSAHWNSPGGWRVVLYGQGVTVEFTPLEHGSWMGTDFVSHPIEPDEVDKIYKPGFYRQMEAFGHLVRTGNNDPHAQDLRGAHKTMLLAEKIAMPV